MFLDHPLLIKNYCTLVDNRNIYQLMEFMEGSTLQSQSYELKKKSVKQETPVHSLSEIREILSQLLEAISYMHSKNIPHRDLKPANIFVSNVIFDILRTMRSKLGISDAQFTNSPMTLLELSIMWLLK